MWRHTSSRWHLKEGGKKHFFLDSFDIPQHGYILKKKKKVSMTMTFFFGHAWVYSSSRGRGNTAWLSDASRLTCWGRFSWKLHELRPSAWPRHRRPPTQHSRWWTWRHPTRHPTHHPPLLHMDQVHTLCHRNVSPIANRVAKKPKHAVTWVLASNQSFSYY